MNQTVGVHGATLFEAVNVGRRFDDGTEALAGISLSTRASGFAAIVGPSGCGKSTLLMMIAGLMQPSAGQIVLAGSPVTAPRAERARFQHVELISTQGRQVLMVLVFVGGEVSQQLLTLAEPVPQERLSQSATRLNGLLAGRSLEEIASSPTRSDALEQDILTLVSQEMRRTTERLSGEVYTDGLMNVLSEPEFSGSDDARRALKIFEERTSLQALLARALINSSVGGLQVLIGGEGEWEELRQCSMVLARYGVPGLVTGTLGVLGPMRMSYARTIPTVRFVAGLLSDMVNDRIAGE